jgi:predicted nucleotide-binding protein (sugar kinase/HSP70/actin superfamily)
LDSLQAAVADFNLIGEKTGQYPRSGIVGEIYVKYNAFSNNHVAQWLIDQGVEVVLPHFFEFFAGSLVALQHGVKTHVKRRDATWLLTFLGQKLIHDFTQQFEAVMLRYRHFHSHPDVHDVAQLAKDILSINHQYGEGWLLAGEIASFVQHGVENVLCLQPFGCIANHVIAKGVQKRLQATYPQLNLLFLDADAGVSEVNFFNRMHFFLEQARAPLELTA